MTHYLFDCGCKIPVLNEKPKTNDNLPSMEIPYEEIQIALNYGKQCDKTFDLISGGNTKGVFQLETNLGRGWSKRLQPSNIEEMAALISLLRPGCLNAIVDGKSMTQHYIDRKQGLEESICPYKSIAHILEPTYNVLTFQEQAMRIAVDAAGFNEQEADVLRKAIGKKIPELMTKVKTTFMEGCEKVGLLTKEESEEVFSWIEKSQRYSFNKSHAVSYGFIGYLSGFAKLHFPLHFYCSYIKYARDKQKTQDEIKELVNDSKLFEVDILPPSIETLFDNYSDVCVRDDSVRFGIRSVKKIGQAAIKKLLDNIVNLEKELGKKVRNFTWLEVLCFLLPKITSTSVNGLISIGVFDHLKMSRNRMLHEYNCIKQLTAKEQGNLHLFFDRYDSLENILVKLVQTPKAQGGPSNKNRVTKIWDVIKVLNNPPYSTTDTPTWILTQEKELLGVGLSYGKVDTIPNAKMGANTTCKEFNDGKGSNDIRIAAEIVRSSPYKIKRGQNEGQEMCFLTVEDNTGSLDCVAFSDVWDAYGQVLYEGNVLLFSGYRSKKDSFAVQKIFKI